MRNFSHYLPFFIITAVLYAAIFYHHKEVTVITPLPLNSGQQSVQIQFINTQKISASHKNADQLKQDNNKPIADKVHAKAQKAVSNAREKVQEQQQNTSISAHTKSNAEITAARQNLQKSISKVTAKHDAELKAEFFAEQLQQDTSSADNSSKSAQNKQTSALPISSKKLKKLTPQAHTVSTEVIAQHKKNKRVFKKKPTLNHAAAISSTKIAGYYKKR